MRNRHLVPTLAMLALAGMLPAEDGVAPVTTLAVDDTLLTPFSDGGSVPDVLASDAIPPDTAIDLSTLFGRFYAYSTSTWVNFSGRLTTAGIAVIAAHSDGAGDWEYYDGTSWLTLPGAISDANAFLIPLGNSEPSYLLRFHAYASSGDARPTLSFRAWDGTSGTPLSMEDTTNSDLFAPQTYGGSPTAFSAETRTLTVQVVAENDSPALVSDPAAPEIIAFIPKTVGDLLATTAPFTDPDPATNLGIAIDEFDTVDAGWEYSQDGGTNWSSLATVQPGAESGTVFVLGPDDQLRYTGSGSGSELLTLHAWDQTMGAPGDTFVTDGSISGSSIGVVVNANNQPVLVSPSSPPFPPLTIDVRRGTDYELSLSASDIDTDDQLTWSAASTSYSSGGTVTVGDSSAAETTATYAAPTDPTVTSDEIEVTITDLAGNQATALVTVNIIENASPTWTAPGPFNLDEVTVGEEDPSGTYLSDLLINAIDDLDGNPDGIAIIGATTTGFGTWQIGNDVEGIYYSDLGEVSDNAAILLDSLDSRLIRYLPGSSNETVTLTIRAWDQTSNDTDLTNPVDGGHVSLETRTITVVVAGANAAPEITSHPTSQSVITGRPLTLTFAGMDPDGDALTWTLSGDIAGTAYSDEIAGTSPEFSLTAGNPGSGTLNVTVSDGTDNASIDINVEVLANNAPAIISAAPGTIAISGQPWEALVTATDADAGDLALLAAGGVPTSWMTLSQLGAGRWKIHGTPGNGNVDTTTSFFFTVSDPSSAQASVSFSVTVLDSSVQPVSGPQVPVSTPGAVTYASIHPGSSANLTSLSAALALSGRQRARGFWWSPGGAAFGELPASPADPASAGIFVASLDPLNVTYDAPIHAAPYAITLPANSWSFIGIPPIQLDAVSSTATTSHAWDDFRLETTAGVPLDETTVLSVLAGTSNLADIEPWSWDGTAYNRVETLQTGTAYWVRNRSSTTYRLVRATSGASGTFGTMGVQPSPAPAPMAVNLAQAPETPPAPPSGLASPASQPAQQADGSCGAGGLAGLFAATLLALGLRRRRN